MNDHDRPDDAGRPDPQEAPQVFALQKEGATWSISRRGFIAGTGAIAAASSGCGKPAKPLAHSSGISAVLATSDGEKLITGGQDTQVKLWDLPSGNLSKSLAGAPAAITSLAISGDGKRMAAGCANGSIRLWSLTGADAGGTVMAGASPVEGLALSDDGSFLFAKQFSQIHVFSLKANGAGAGAPVVGTIVKQFNEPLLVQHAFARFGGGIVSVTACSDQTLRLRFMSAPDDPRTHKRGAGTPTHMAVSPGGDLVAVLLAGPDQVEVWSMSGGKMIASGTVAAGASSMRFSGESALSFLVGRALRTCRIEPPNIVCGDSIDLNFDAEDDKEPGGAGGVVVVHQHKVVVQTRGRRVVTWSLDDGKAQPPAFRDPVASAKPAASSGTASKGTSGGTSGGGGGGGSRRSGGHYWRPN